MSAQIKPSQELKQFLAPSVKKAKFSSAFEVFGLWTPGILLMRNLRFKLKASLIFLVVLLPISLLAWFYFSSELRSLKSTQKERAGVEYAAAIFPVIEAALDSRRDILAAMTDGDKPAAEASRAKLMAVHEQLAKAEKKLGAELKTEKAYQEVKQSLAKAIDEKEAASVFNSYSAHVKDLIGLIGAVGDGAELTIDPEMATYHMIDGLLFRLPDVIDKTAKLRGEGNRVLVAGSISPEQQRRLSEYIPIAEFQGENLTSSLNTAFEAKPELKKTLNVSQVLKDTEDYFAYARKNVVDQQVYSTEVKGYYRSAGNRIITEQFDLSKKLFIELDAMLLERINANNIRFWIALGVILFSVTLLAYLFVAFYRVTEGGLQLIRFHLNEVAQGDLRHAPAKPWGKDETADVIIDLQQTYTALHELIRTVRHSARALHGTTSEIARASLDLSARSESAASTLEEQAAAIEEIGSTVQNSTEKANKAASFAANNASVAEDGGHIIKSVVDTMHQIQASSSKVSDIISVIDGIAFQTNILALNAAVEAARAGEAGRGFAVVASEVRSLAHRSAEAAKEIKRLISDSVGQVNGGIEVVEKAGSTMVTIVDNAKQINAYLTEISAGAREQATGIAQVANSINELDDHTQQNAALVEQTSAACDALTQQAESMQKDIAKFVVA